MKLLRHIKACLVLMVATMDSTIQVLLLFTHSSYNIFQICFLMFIILNYCVFISGLDGSVGESKDNGYYGYGTEVQYPVIKTREN